MPPMTIFEIISLICYQNVTEMLLYIIRTELYVM